MMLFRGLTLILLVLVVVMGRSSRGAQRWFAVGPFAFQPSEVAKLVLVDPRSFASLPVGELAERSHVSKPTVVRFCRSVGYNGLADFKLKLEIFV